MPFNPNIEARTSETHGRGLFATARIPAGTAVWRFAAAEDTPNSLTGEMTNTVYTQAQLEELAIKEPDNIEDVLWGGYIHDPTGEFIRLKDGGQFTNHSETPNCGGAWSDTPLGEFSIAVRDIEAGEEITDDYGTYQDMAREWLVALFKKYTPARAKFESECVAEKPKGFIHTPTNK